MFQLDQALQQICASKVKQACLGAGLALALVSSLYAGLNREREALEKQSHTQREVLHQLETQLEAKRSVYLALGSKNLPQTNLGVILKQNRSLLSLLQKIALWQPVGVHLNKLSWHPHGCHLEGRSESLAKILKFNTSLKRALKEEHLLKIEEGAHTLKTLEEKEGLSFLSILELER
jgi:hypothetical protein